MRNGDIKHLCDDNCFKVFRANPTSFLRAQQQKQTPKTPATTNGAITIDDDDDVPKKGEPTKSSCSVCKKITVTKHEVNFGGKLHKICGDPCFAAFRYSNKLSMNMCEACNTVVTDGPAVQSIQFEGQMKKFCTMNCLTAFKGKRSKIVPCTWCGTRKSNFDMVERVEAGNKFQLFCTLNCLSLYRVNVQATSNKNVKCDQCTKAAPAQYHLTMSDASVRNFCSYPCVMAFQGQFTQGSGPAPSSRSSSRQRQSRGKMIVIICKERVNMVRNR